MTTTYSSPTRDETIRWLDERQPERLDVLWHRADRVRQECVGDAIHLRGLLEISSYCDRSCHYCGLRVENERLPRYRMTAEEIQTAAHEAVARGYGTVVMQAGEDPGLDIDQLCHVIQTVKARTRLAVTLSLGERTDDELRALRDAGADRYLLRFETSNLQLLQTIHPGNPGDYARRRIELLSKLRELGYELGSGVMIGIPGQSIDDLANDIELFRELNLDMIGVGPYIPHPETPLFSSLSASDQGDGTSVAADELTTYKVLALARLVCPLANIPSTTALATLGGPSARKLGLQRGANVIMPNLTPTKYRQDYEIYPHKAGSRETEAESRELAQQQVLELGRTWATGRGDSPNLLARHKQRE